MLEVVDNPAERRFEAHLDGKVAGCIDYSINGTVITLIHTIVPAEHEGKGIASRLVNFALEHARANGLLVIPRCPFVAAYLNRHPEYLDVVARS